MDSRLQLLELKPTAPAEVNKSEEIVPNMEDIVQEAVNSVVCTLSKHKTFGIAFVQCNYWSNIEDVGPTLYKCYTNVLCLLGSGRNNLQLIENKLSTSKSDTMIRQ